ncbi:hypothetical protein A4S06_07485 [Erysipelotrichaceae bacterium MTC7]|nr:hypothetical protein A4S06_07485 [Erysipelotrichaceae bacterium MTC7]
MRNKLNIFEYFTQKDALPIENNSTRNLSIVLKNSEISMNRFIKFIDRELKANKHDTFSIYSTKDIADQEVMIQKSIKELAKMDFAIDNLVGITLTTESLGNFEKFVDFEVDENDRLIPDISILFGKTLILIEAKKTNEDAREQLISQIEAYSNKRKDGDVTLEGHELVSVTWKQVLTELLDLNDELNGQDIILNDYIEHVKNRLPDFFPELPLSQLYVTQEDLIKKRLNYLIDLLKGDAESSYEYTVKRNDYWIDLSKYNKGYVSMMSLQVSDGDVCMRIHPGNNVTQGKSLYSETNKLSILHEKTICVKDQLFEIQITPNLKFSNNWGTWLGDVEFKRDVTREELRTLFQEVGRRYHITNDQLPFDLELSIEKYKDIVDMTTFKNKFNSLFLKSNMSSFTVSISINIQVKELFAALRNLDVKEQDNSDLLNARKLDKFLNDMVTAIFTRIEN